MPPIEVEQAEIRGPFFDALGVPIVAGRGFAPNDVASSRLVVVNEVLARRIFAGSAAPGKTLWIANVPYDVIGVARDYASNPLRVAADEPRVFVPLGDEDSERQLQLVVRAAGVSVARIAMWVVGAGVILMILTGVLGELVAPQMEQYGRRMKTFEKYHDYSLAGNRSAWAKDGNTIVAVGQQSGDNRYGGVYVFNFDAQHRLHSVGRASSASIDPNNVWRLESYRESRFEEDHVVARGPAQAQVRTRLSAGLGATLTRPSASSERSSRLR